MRRFGCLAWFMREPIKDLGKLEARWCRGVYLGPALASRSHLIGHYVLDDRKTIVSRFPRVLIGRTYLLLVSCDVEPSFPPESMCYDCYCSVDRLRERHQLHVRRRGDRGLGVHGKGIPLNRWPTTRCGFAITQTLWEWTVPMQYPLGLLLYLKLPGDHAARE